MVCGSENWNDGKKLYLQVYSAKDEAWLNVGLGTFRNTHILLLNQKVRQKASEIIVTAVIILYIYMVPFISQISTLQCLADCRYNNHFTYHRHGTTLGKAMAAVKQHIKNYCYNSKDHEGIFETGKVYFNGWALYLSILLGLCHVLSCVSLLWRERVVFCFFVCFKTLVIEKLAGEPNILTVPEKKFNGPQVTIWLAHTATLLNPYTSLFMLPRQETTSSDTATGNEHTEIPMVEDAEIMPVRENWNSKKILSWGRASLVSLSVETFFLNTKNVRLIEMRWDGGGGEEFPPPCETTTFCLPVSDMNIFMQLSNQCYSMCYCLLCVLL